MGTFAERRAVTPEEIAAFVDALAAGVAKGDAESLRFAEAMAIERSRNGAAGAHKFWQRLAAGEFDDEASVRETAGGLGVSLAPGLLGIALELDDGFDSGDLAQLRRLALDVFASGEWQVGALESTSGIELLVPVAREVDASNARTAAMLLPKTIAKRKLALRVSGGVGGFGPPMTASAHLSRARNALAVGRRIFGAGRVHVYDDLGGYALLHAGATPDDLRAFAAGVLGPLREYDRKHQTELERTLRLYFACGQNVKTAAAQLVVHRHTVFYRLRQIAEICRCDLATAHDQLTLRLAIAIDALHS